MNYLSDDNKNIANYLDKVYPVGSIYMSTNSTSPATLFGGEWKALNEGRVLIGANSTYPVNSTGGEFEHTLTEEETPSHTHTGSNLLVSGKLTSVAFDPYLSISASGAFTISGERSYWRAQGTSKTIISTRDVTLSGVPEGTTDSTGGSQPHNNMQPYLAVYMWERTA